MYFKVVQSINYIIINSNSMVLKDIVQNSRETLATVKPRNIVKKKSNVFDDEFFLKKYDNILMLAKHYKTIFNLHFNELQYCKNIIDLGCGSGNLVLKLAKNVQKVTGVDISEVSLNYIRKQAKNLNNIKLINADITQLDTIKSNTYDGVSSMICAHLTDNFENHIKEAHRILKPGGKFILTARDKNGVQERLINIVEQSLLKENKKQQLQDDYDAVCDRLLLTANNRSPSLKTKSQTRDVLTNVGFKNILSCKNNSEDVMYSFVATK